LKVWVDLTNSPHVLVMRPVIEELERRGADVTVTARDFAQTLALCERFGIEHQAIGHHRGGRLAAKALGLFDRSFTLARWAKGRRFDIALGHGSNDITVAARLRGVPATTTFDYEFARVQHTVNCRLAQAVVVPDVIPPERLRPYGATAAKLRGYPGLKEEYYLADFEPDDAVLEELGLDSAKALYIVRTPPDVSLYHRFENPLFGRVLEHLRNSSPPAQIVVLPRTAAQRAELAKAGGFVVPEGAVDAQTLVARADLVISAGGTMNREAVALGTPVYTTFEGRLGAVDERLIAEGRLRKLTAAEDIDLGGSAERPTERVRRDPAAFTDLLLTPINSP
jgi:predicted glycosyltransferase